MNQDEALKTITSALVRGNKARALLVHVAAMRVAQREYFEKRGREALAKAKDLEAQVDAGLEELRRK